MFKRLLCFWVIIAIALCPFIIGDKVFAQHEQLPSSQISKIKANCSSAKSILNRLHATDALLRVNRGQLYDSLETKLMDQFNSRVALNGLNGVELLSVTTEYKNAMDNFRSNYQTYEEAMTDLIGIDCYNSPQEFYYKVEDVRNDRSQVHESVVKLNEQADNYNKALDTFLTSYKAATEEANNER
jgi:hypothetical protein